MIRLLFVDDQPRELDGLVRMMDWETMGIRIAGAVTDPGEALRMAAEHQTDIVVTDVIMQNMDGLTLVKELGEHCPWVQTVCISAFDDFKFVSMALNYGACGYLLKPILVHEMRAVLEKIIRNINGSLPRFIDRGHAALMVLGVSDWWRDLPPGQQNLEIRILTGPAQSLSSFPGVLDLPDGHSVVLVSAAEPIPENAISSEPVLPSEAVKAYSRMLSGDPDFPPCAADDNALLVEHMKKNIDTHLGEDIGMAEILQDIPLSGSYASTLFKRFTGTTLHRYVIHQRLSRAERMLLERSDLKIRDIALYCGFTDASHLINSFQKEYGITPNDYRVRNAHKEKP